MNPDKKDRLDTSNLIMKLPSFPSFPWATRAPSHKSPLTQARTPPPTVEEDVVQEYAKTQEELNDACISKIEHR